MSSKRRKPLQPQHIIQDESSSNSTSEKDLISSRRSIDSCNSSESFTCEYCGTEFYAKTTFLLHSEQCIHKLLLIKSMISPMNANNNHQRLKIDDQFMKNNQHFVENLVQEMGKNGVTNGKKSLLIEELIKNRCGTNEEPNLSTTDDLAQIQTALMELQRQQLLQLQLIQRVIMHNNSSQSLSPTFVDSNIFEDDHSKFNNSISRVKHDTSFLGKKMDFLDDMMDRPRSYPTQLLRSRSVDKYSSNKSDFGTYRSISPADGIEELEEEEENDRHSSLSHVPNFEDSNPIDLSISNNSQKNKNQHSSQPKFEDNDEQRIKNHKRPHRYSRKNVEEEDEDEDWEDMMEITSTDEMAKVRQLMGGKEMKIVDPNQCMICDRILSCKSALQMHYRTHTGNRPFRCKVCQRAFTTKGNLKTHMGIHRTRSTFRLGHQCPICHKRFNNGLILQQHVTCHLENRTNEKQKAENNNKVDEIEKETINNSEQKPLIESFKSAKNGSAFFPFSKLEISTGVEDFCSQESESALNLASKKSQNAATEKIMKLSATKVDDRPAINFCPTTMTAHPFPFFAFNMSNFRTTSPPPSVAKNVQSESSSMTSTLSVMATHSSGRTNNQNLHHRPKLVEVNGGQHAANGHLQIPAANPYSPVMGPTPMQMAAMMSGRPNTTCNICFKVFACYSALEIHYRSHTKERPFKCEICFRGFSTKGNMKQHLLTHKIRDLPSSSSSSSNGGHNLHHRQMGSGNSEAHHYSSSSFHSNYHRRSHSHGFSSAANFSGKAMTIAENLSTKNSTGAARSISSQNMRGNVESHTVSSSSPTIDNTHKNSAHLHPSSVEFHLVDSSPSSKIEPENATTDCAPPVSPNPLESIQKMWARTENLSSSSLSNVLAAESFSSDKSVCLLDSRSSNSKSNTALSTNASVNANSSVSSSSTSANKHQCQLCYKNFSSASALQIHMRTHTGDRPFSCKICTRAFTTKGNLKVHMGTHMWTTTNRRGRRLFDVSHSPQTDGRAKTSQSFVNVSENGSDKPDRIFSSQARSPSGELTFGNAKSSPVIDIGRPFDAASLLDSDRPSIPNSISNRPAGTMAAPPPSHPFHASSSAAYFMAAANPFAAAAAAAAAAAPSTVVPPLNLFSLPGVPTTRFLQQPPNESLLNQQELTPSFNMMNNFPASLDQKPLEAMVLMWQNVCWVCRKECASKSDLQDHLQTHLTLTSPLMASNRPPGINENSIGSMN